MLTASPSTFRGWMALLPGLAIALTGSAVACGGRTSDLGDGGTSSGGSGGGSGSGSGSFPYRGPSCSPTTISDACWSCVEGSCPALAACVTGACSGYFQCFCACNEGDVNCEQQCTQGMNPACNSCAQSTNNCSAQSCQAQCQTTMTGGSGGSSTGGGSSGGPGTASECSGSTMPCANGQFLQSCTSLENGACTSAYFTVGTQTFPCTSCTDTASCQQQANAACQ